jgi:hypothetical protein
MRLIRMRIPGNSGGCEWQGIPTPGGALVMPSDDILTNDHTKPASQKACGEVATVYPSGARLRSSNENQQRYQSTDATSVKSCSGLLSSHDAANMLRVSGRLRPMYAGLRDEYA